MNKETPDMPVVEEAAAVDFSLPPFHLGTDYESYKYFGAHPAEEGGVRGTYFRVWAPNAKNVSVITEVTGWDNFCPLQRTKEDHSVWECFLPGVDDGDMYRYVVDGADGILRYKSDPYGFRSEKRPANASSCLRPRAVRSEL